MLPLLTRLLHRKFNPQHRCGMLYFHRILPAPDPFFPDDLTLPQFELLISRLSSMFELVTPESWLQGQLPSGRPSLMISFDDGYKDNVSAAKVLERYNVRGTFFVSTQAIASGGSAESLWQNKVLAHYRYLAKTLPLQMQPEVAKQCAHTLSRLKYMLPEQVETACRQMHGRDYSGLDMMTPSDLRALAKHGHCIGLHTHRHAILTTLTDNDAADELETSLAWGRQVLPSQSGFVMAYPNGTPGKDFSKRHMQMVREMGFLAAFGTADGGFQAHHLTPPLHRFALPRFLPYRKHPLLRTLSTCKIIGESEWESDLSGMEDSGCRQRKIPNQQLNQGEV